jgi:hypothetical protein
MLDGLMVGIPILTAANVWVMYSIPLIRTGWIAVRFYSVIAIGFCAPIAYSAHGIVRTIADDVISAAAVAIILWPLAARWIYKSLDEENKNLTSS